MRALRGRQLLTKQEPAAVTPSPIPIEEIHDDWDKLSNSMKGNRRKSQSSYNTAQPTALLTRIAE